MSPIRFHHTQRCDQSRADSANGKGTPPRVPSLTPGTRRTRVPRDVGRGSPRGAPRRTHPSSSVGLTVRRAPTRPRPDAPGPAVGASLAHTWQAQTVTGSCILSAAHAVEHAQNSDRSAFMAQGTGGEMLWLWKGGRRSDAVTSWTRVAFMADGPADGYPSGYA